MQHDCMIAQLHDCTTASSQFPSAVAKQDDLKTFTSKIKLHLTILQLNFDIVDCSLNKVFLKNH